MDFDLGDFDLDFADFTPLELDPDTPMVFPTDDDDNDSSSQERYVLNTGHTPMGGALNKFHLMEGLICLLYQYVIEMHNVPDAGELADYVRQWKQELMGNKRVPHRQLMWRHYNFFLRPILKMRYTRETIMTRDILPMDRKQCIECIKQYQLGAAKWRYFKRYNRIVAIVMKIINYVMSQETGCSVEFYTASSSPRSPAPSGGGGSNAGPLEGKSRVIVNYPSTFATYIARGGFTFKPIFFTVRDMLIFATVSEVRTPNVTNVYMTWVKEDSSLHFQQAEDIKSGDSVVIWYKNAAKERRRGVLKPGVADMKSCVVCGSEAQDVCVGCEKRAYCGVACQRVDWKRGHEGDCTSPRRGEVQHE